MTFHDKPYLISIYKDKAHHVVLQSSVQTGKSEFLIICALSRAEIGWQVMYVLPSDEMRNLFVANRVDTLCKKVPYYAMLLKEAAGVTANRSLKHFGKGTLFFVGSGSKTAFIEKPIDCIIGDETDRFDLNNYEKADDRMTASPHKYKYEASNPTVEKFGINSSYLSTDQREFMIKCPHCNQWQIMDWFKNVVIQTDDGKYVLRDDKWEFGCNRDIHVLCTRCERPLERFTQQAVWVPRYPKMTEAHGYHISQFMSSFVSVYEMWKKFSKGTEDDVAMQVFYNSVLGIPYAGSGSKLNDEILNTCKREYLMPSSAEKCVMGIDVGKRLHVVIRQPMADGALRLVFAGTVQEFEDIEELVIRYKVMTFVVDAMPETRKSRDLCAQFRGKGFIARYQDGLTELRVDDKDYVVSADRTMLMDRVNKAFQQQTMILPANAQSLDRGEYYDLLKTPTRIFDENRDRYVWVGDPDHYFHAEVYCYCAYKVRGEFSVTGIDVSGGSGAFVQPPSEGEFEKMFPPGTPKSIIDHYRKAHQELMSSQKRG